MADKKDSKAFDKMASDSGAIMGSIYDLELSETQRKKVDFSAMLELEEIYSDIKGDYPNIELHRFLELIQPDWIEGRIMENDPEATGRSYGSLNLFDYGGANFDYSDYIESAKRGLSRSDYKPEVKEGKAIKDSSDFPQEFGGSEEESFLDRMSMEDMDKRYQSKQPKESLGWLMEGRFNAP